MRMLRSGTWIRRLRGAGAVVAVAVAAMIGSTGVLAGAPLVPSAAADVDTDPPVVTFLSEPTDTNSPSPWAYTFEANEPATFTCGFSNERQPVPVFVPCTSPYTYSLWGGPQTVTVVATDAAGNQGRAESSIYWTDPLAPVVVIDTTPSLQSSDTLTFTFSSPTAVSYVCNMSGPAGEREGPCTSPVSYTGLPDGLWHFFVRATDADGRVDNLANGSTPFRITDKGRTTISAGPPAATSATTASFVWDDSFFLDYTSTCSLDGAVPTACTSPLTFDGLVDGPHTFTVRQIRADVADVVEQPGAEWHWTVDTVAPTIAFTGRPPASTGAMDASFTFDVTDPGPSSGAGRTHAAAPAGTTVTCALDGGTAAACDGHVDYTGLHAGDHDLVVTATDAAGNATHADATWTIVAAAVTTTTTAPTATTATPRPSTTAPAPAGATPAAATPVTGTLPLTGSRSSLVAGLGAALLLAGLALTALRRNWARIRSS